MMDEVKRVACLYRVSTKAQVDKTTDDIPMQKNACMEFIKTKPNWKLEKEYIEKGVSGYKKKAADRDVLTQIKNDAEKGLFDVFLVFMFDRLGRRDDETPFVLRWFTKIGVETWSVKEGQQTFDDHVDDLINYIRFWQSGGESKKTGIRVKEKHSQMIKDGLFCGGPPPYGYKLIWSERTNNKGRRLKQIVIDEEESQVVKLVYTLATVNGYGGYRIANYLNEQGILTRKGGKWGLTVTNYMLRNPIYKGYPTYGKTSARSGSNKRQNPNSWLISDVKIEELAIIDENVWEKAQRIRKKRTPGCFLPEAYSYAQYPQQTKSPLLFTGLIKCGHCGCTLCSYSSVAKWETKDGVLKSATKASYRCTSANRGIQCDGQKTYVQNRIEGPVLDEIYQYLDGLAQIDLTSKIQQIREKNLKQEEKALRLVQKKRADKEQELKTLNHEIVNALSGNSSFTGEQLAKAIAQVEEERTAILADERMLINTIEEKSKEINKLVNLQAMLPNWREEFSKTSTDIKKMLISELIEEVIVYRTMIEVKFRIDLETFIG